jgi:lysozyme family protein
VLAVAGIASSPAAALGRVQVPGLQVALYRYGFYKGPIDGIAGPQTKQAIRQLQRARKLEVDGVPGRHTRAALGRFGRPLFGKRTLHRGMFGLDVSVLQFLLAKHGLRPPRITSAFGGVTEQLVRRFQRKAGLAVDGVVGPATRAALLGGRRHTHAAARARPAVRAHVVQPGETLTSIALGHGTSVAAIANLNGLDPRRTLLAGAKLRVPLTQATAPQSSVRSSISHWAAHYGVDELLVRGLAWQESGFQNDVRSNVGASGVLQVMPSTWSFVELFVIGQRVPRTTDGNVRVGIAYLAHLLHQFHGDQRLALAAYYQGPAHVRRGHLLRETRRFVANVLALRGRV